MKKLLITAMVALSMGLLTACNTVQGVGKDVSKGGEEIQKVATKV